MLPIEIKIKNFMSYGDNQESLDFSEFDLASLIGQNGSGKSSLLESITWVLWGKARDINKGDQRELIHAGSSEMEVEITFSVNHQKFKVFRKLTPKNSILRLERFEKDEFYDISEDSLLDTQKKITDEILRMPYDVFINSAFLRQGKADEFTTKSPNKRKEVLAEILGLTYYEEIVKLARFKLRENKGKQDQLQVLLEDNSDILEKEKRHQKEIEVVKQEIGKEEKQKKQIEDDLNKIQSKQSKLIAQNEGLKEKKDHSNSLSNEINNNQKRLDKIRSNIDKNAIIITESEKIEKNFQAWEENSKQNQESLKKEDEQRKLSNKRNEVEDRVDSEKRKLEYLKAELAGKISTIEQNQKESSELEKELKKSKIEFKNIEQTEQEKIKSEKIIYRLKEENARLKTKNQNIEQLGEDTKEKLDLIDQADSDCPLCKQKLTENHRTNIQSEIKEELSLRRQTWLENKQAIENNEEKITDHKSKVTKLERTILAKDHITQKIGELESQIKQNKEKTSQLKELRDEFVVIDDQLNNNAFSPLDQEILKKLDQEIKDINYNPELHQNIRVKLEKLKSFVEKKHTLDHAREIIKQDEKEQAELEESIKKKQEQQTKLVKEQEKATFNLKDFDQINQLISQLKQQQLKNDGVLGKLKNNFATLEEKIKQYQKIRESIEQRKEELKILNQQSKNLKIIEESFGKNGIQAMIIENAIPEIENESNLILDRMTNGQMKVELETQKEKKTGGNMESLEIKIIDKLGPRSYELFSGGEAFRINFAIRVALSKLLSRRANAKLQFLVIDEGFGTQDNEGIANLINSVKSIRDDFDKILVISHLEKVKEAFPTRIEVIKDEAGSHLELKE